MDADDEDAAVSEIEDDGDEDGDLELRDLDPNAEDEARRVERQLRRMRRETRN